MHRLHAPVGARQAHAPLHVDCLLHLQQQGQPRVVPACGAAGSYAFPGFLLHVVMYCSFVPSRSFGLGVLSPLFMSFSPALPAPCAAAALTCLCLPYRTVSPCHLPYCHLPDHSTPRVVPSRATASCVTLEPQALAREGKTGHGRVRRQGRGVAERGAQARVVRRGPHRRGLLSNQGGATSSQGQG